MHQTLCEVFLQSKTHVVLATLKRAASELSDYQKKLFKVDNHVGIAIAGLTADGRVLSRYMRSECINHQYAHTHTDLHTQRLCLLHLCEPLGHVIEKGAHLSELSKCMGLAYVPYKLSTSECEDLFVCIIGSSHTTRLSRQQTEAKCCWRTAASSKRYHDYSTRFRLKEVGSL